MNLGSIILIVLVSVWFVWAVVYIIRHRGCGCCEGKNKRSCNGQCEACGRCGHRNNG